MLSTDQTLEAGSLLIAVPVSDDPNFRRSVVLVCEHAPEGTFGLVLNRPLELQLHDVIEDEDLPPCPLALGGPVQQNTLHFLHGYGARIDDSIDIIDGVSWGGDFDLLKETLRSGPDAESRIRLFLGYSGWSAGQLEEEIALGGWIISRATSDVVFSNTPEQLWRTVLRTMGGDYAALSNFPDDPRMN